MKIVVPDVDAPCRAPSNVTAAVEGARGIHIPPQEVMAAWRALYEGRWTIVSSVERDGRRFLVARPDVPLRGTEHQPSAEVAGDRGPRPPPRLSTQEMRVLAELAKGHSNKAIAYDLGICTSTVATLLARAARKLGCKDRLALARVGRTLAHHPIRPVGRRND